MSQTFKYAGPTDIFNLLVVSMFALLCVQAKAEPFVNPGDPWLRHDIQQLADAGIIRSPVTAWPMSVGDLMRGLNTIDPETIDDLAVRGSLLRLYSYMSRHMEVGVFNWEGEVRLTERVQRVQSFADTARGRQELSFGTNYTGERVAVNLQASYEDGDPTDDKTLRLDGSYASIALGNWMFSAGMQDRYWGPGWNSSLLLSNSARPIPALTLQRNFSIPFSSRWLSWIGPWSTSIIWGQLEKSRPVSNARYFAWRVNARPRQNLEIGLQRAVQWCGSGRDCSVDAFLRSIVGDSNLDVGVTEDVANQLAGVDFRWSSPIGSLPYAIYGQFIGEDEAGGFPSKYMGQFGAEIWGNWESVSTSWRVYAEYADTTCQFNESSPIFNCAYNNSSYPDGLRYRGRSIGHSSDNDAKTIALGLVSRTGKHDWGMSLRFMDLNRGGSADFTNGLTPTPLEQVDADLFYRSELHNGAVFDARVGLIRQDDVQGDDRTDIRASIGLSFSFGYWN